MHTYLCVLLCVYVCVFVYVCWHFTGHCTTSARLHSEPLWIDEHHHVLRREVARR